MLMTPTTDGRSAMVFPRFERASRRLAAVPAVQGSRRRLPLRTIAGLLSPRPAGVMPEAAARPLRLQHHPLHTVVLLVLVVSSGLGGTLGRAWGAETTTQPCPAAASAVVAGLYRVLLADDRRHPQRLIRSQAQRFTPRLAGLLDQAYGLSASGPGMDFDPFSNSQSGLFGYNPGVCWRDGGGKLWMRVSVRAGLSAARSSLVPLDYALTSGGGGWRIADIRYPSTENFSLIDYLESLTQQRP